MATPYLDVLVLLRRAIVDNHEYTPVASPDSTETAPLSKATHLRFTVPDQPEPTVVPLDTTTRLEVSAGTVATLRSVTFAFQHKNSTVPEYDAAVKSLNDDLAAAAAASEGGESIPPVQLFAYVERLDLITWLEGASDDSEYIRPVQGGQDVGAAGVGAIVGAGPGGVVVASGLLGASTGGQLDGRDGTAGTGSAASGVDTGSGAMGSTGVSGRSGKGTLDPRLAAIYAGERKMGDRNSALRGSKLVDFSGIRKLAATFTAKRNPYGATQTSTTTSLAINQKPTRRPDPIILLSPSASSLLRLSNIRDFLDTGRYHPTDNTSTASMLYISRIMKDIDPVRPMRFILVEGPEQFKPEYWNRVVAVFTTGQTWQFKNYKWSQPQELFKHVLGVHVGWRGDLPPDNVRSWGHRVNTFQIDKWRDPSAVGVTATDTSRWRDREVVENVWKAISGAMRARGWKQDAGPISI